MRFAVILALVLAGLLAPQARAQGPLPQRNPVARPHPPQITGDIVADTKANFGAEGGAEGLWQKIVTASLDDLRYAKALADNTGTTGGKMRSACYGALITANQQANGIGLKDSAGAAITKPDPALVTNFEQIAEVADNLQPTSPLIVACAPVANAVKQSVTQIITMVITGAASLAALGIP